MSLAQAACNDYFFPLEISEETRALRLLNFSGCSYRPSVCGIISVAVCVNDECSSPSAATTQ